ncbi:MAG: hypothetical protein J1E98_07325 [Lachnospiraceae bacterium]|nr:hypothetical protein [Lachnospiraceae bacterium]
MSDKYVVNERNAYKMRIKKILAMTVLVAVIVLSGCSSVDDTSVRTTGEDTRSDMQVNMQEDVDTDELVINTQLLQYMNMTYAQFKEQVGTEAEFYHGLYFQAPIPDKGANAVFLGSYDDEVAGSVLSDEDKSFRVESSLSNIISGITGEMTVAEFVEMLGSHAGFAYEIHHEIQEGLTAYYVAYHYVEMNIDSNGDGVLDIQLNIALDEADYITPDASTWIYESAFFEDSVEDDETADGPRFSEQDAELINMGIHNNEHNIYMGSIVKEEMRMIITRTDNSLSAAYITRDDEEKVFKGELKKDSAGFILKTDAGEYLEGSIRAEDNGGVFIYGKGVISGNEVAFTLSQNTFFPIDEDTENYYSSLGYDAKAVERFVKQIKNSINDKTEFAKLISYPISIEIDGSDISIENEKEMLDVYDKLIEQKGFKQQIESIYTKYMFANYMGICVEDGIMWIQQDSSGDYKIYAINVPKLNKEIEDIVSAFASAFFAADTDAIQKYLVDPYEWGIDVYDNPDQADKVNIIGIKGIPGNLAGNVGDECVASLEFSNPGEDSLTYLTIELVKYEDSWKVKFYGLEK